MEPVRSAPHEDHVRGYIQHVTPSVSQCLDLDPLLGVVPAEEPSLLQGVSWSSIVYILQSNVHA